jgi:hypothetical protein
LHKHQFLTLDLHLANQTPFLLNVDHNNRRLKKRVVLFET